MEAEAERHAVPEKAHLAVRSSDRWVVSMDGHIVAARRSEVASLMEPVAFRAKQLLRRCT